MEGEVVQSMRNGTTHRGLFNAEKLLSRLYGLDEHLLGVQTTLHQMKKEILEFTSKEYEVLKEEFIELGYVFMFT